MITVEVCYGGRYSIRKNWAVSKVKITHGKVGRRK
jgi:hypothetical protein